MSYNRRNMLCFVTMSCQVRHCILRTSVIKSTQFSCGQVVRACDYEAAGYLNSNQANKLKTLSTQKLMGRDEYMQ